MRKVDDESRRELGLGPIVDKHVLEFGVRKMSRGLNTFGVMRRVVAANRRAIRNGSIDLDVLPCDSGRRSNLQRGEVTVVYPPTELDLGRSTVVVDDENQ